MIPKNITIHKQVKLLPAEYIGDILLDNNVIIHCRSDGSALGDDGKTYYTVARDDKYGDCEILGYSSDIDAEIDDCAGR